MDPSLEDVNLTTNGQLLDPERAVASGLKRINISLDTLDPEASKPLARSGDLAGARRHRRHLDAGLKVKLNMVPVRSSNRSQVEHMLRYALDRAWSFFIGSCAWATLAIAPPSTGTLLGWKRFSR